MQPRDVVRAVAALAPGRRVVVSAAGERYELPLKPAPAPIEPPHPLEVLSKQLLERDASARATAAEVAARADDAMNAVRTVVADVAAGQARVAQCVAQLAETIALPTEPVYDENGKLMGARRVQKLGA